MRFLLYAMKWLRVHGPNRPQNMGDGMTLVNTAAWKADPDRARKGIPIHPKTPVQIIGGKNWSISFIRLEPLYEHPKRFLKRVTRDSLRPIYPDDFEQV